MRVEYPSPLGPDQRILPETIRKRHVAAETNAKRMLFYRKANEEPIDDGDVLQVLRLWGLTRNRTRRNVRQDDEEYIWSDRGNNQ